jgi:hypothetical protein
MADRGARNLIVLSTSGPSSQAALDVLSELTRRGVRVESTRCDAASATDLAALLQNCVANMPPIKECINAAMSLQVCIIFNVPLEDVYSHCYIIAVSYFPP